MQRESENGPKQYSEKATSPNKQKGKNTCGYWGAFIPKDNVTNDRGFYESIKTKTK